MKTVPLCFTVWNGGHRTGRCFPAPRGPDLFDLFLHFLSLFRCDPAPIPGLLQNDRQRSGDHLVFCANSWDCIGFKGNAEQEICRP